MNNNNSNNNNLSGLSSYFPPLQSELTRNIHTCYSTKTCTYSNSNTNNSNKKMKYITYCPNETTLLKNGITSISKNVHLLSGSYVNKNISLLNEDNSRHKSFMQLYSKAIKNKIHYHQIQHPFDLSSNYTHTHAVTTNADNVHKTYSPQLSSMSTTLSMKYKHKKVSSASTLQIPQDKQEECSDVQHCKEFDLIFSNSINHLKKIKRNKKSSKQFIRSKYTNNAMNEINATHNKLSYLSGVINYIYPKIVLLKTHEYGKYWLYKKHEKKKNNNNELNIQTCPSSLECNVHSSFNIKKRKSKSIGTNICYINSTPSLQNTCKKHHKKHIIKLRTVVK
jgi:hypothetical protein